MDDIEIMEIISGGPAWTSGKLEKGDQILRVAQDKDTVACFWRTKCIVRAIKSNWMKAL